MKREKAAALEGISNWIIKVYFLVYKMKYPASYINRY
jgi:hypothetical protein